MYKRQAPRPNSCAYCGLLFTAVVVGPVTGYLAGTLVGGVFLVSHYLRETQAFHRRVPVEEGEADSPWGDAATNSFRDEPPATDA